MAVYKLPKPYHPDFKIPSKKPFGAVGIDWAFNSRLHNLWQFNGGPSEVESEYVTTSPPPDTLAYDSVGGNDFHGYLNNGSDGLDRSINQYGSGASVPTSSFVNAFMSRNSLTERLTTNTGGYFVAFYVNNVTAKTCVIGESNTGLSPLHQYGNGIGFESGTAFAWRSNNNTNQKVELPIAVGWNVAACCYNGTTVTMSLNGVSASGTCSSSGYASYDFAIGKGAGTARLDGTFYQAGTFRGAMSAAELNQYTRAPYLSTLKPVTPAGYFVSGGVPPVTGWKPYFARGINTVMKAI